MRAAIAGELHANLDAWLPPITEDTMPGELGNCIAGRVANLFNLHGPELHRRRGLRLGDGRDGRHRSTGCVEHEFDVAITGGIDRNMGAATFVKFCAIGALSATGTRPVRATAPTGS